MKSIIVATIFSLSIVNCAIDSALAKEPALSMLQLVGPPDKTHWKLEMADGKLLYTGLVRDRRPEDKDSAESPFPNNSRHWHFTIDKQGDGIGIRFVARDSYPGGYMTGDYSTDPPRVVLSVEPTKYSAWKIHKDEEGQSYLENLNDLGKPAWLAIDDTAIISPMAPDRKRVAEDRRPRLSFQKDYPIVIRRNVMSK